MCNKNCNLSAKCDITNRKKKSAKKTLSTVSMETDHPCKRHYIRTNVFPIIFSLIRVIAKARLI